MLPRARAPTTHSGPWRATGSRQGGWSASGSIAGSGRRGRSWRRSPVASPRAAMAARATVGKRQRLFRAAVRQAISATTVPGAWPKPRAPLALDFNFVNTEHQPPPLWTLPKNYLDLLGATLAPAGDPGPVLFADDVRSSCC